MSKQLFTKLALVLCVSAILSSVTGCGTSVVGPQSSTPQVVTRGFTRPPVHTRVQFAAKKRHVVVAEVK